MKRPPNLARIRYAEKMAKRKEAQEIKPATPPKIPSLIIKQNKSQKTEENQPLRSGTVDYIVKVEDIKAAEKKKAEESVPVVNLKPVIINDETLFVGLQPTEDVNDLANDPIRLLGKKL